MNTKNKQKGAKVAAGLAIIAALGAGEYFFWDDIQKAIGKMDKKVTPIEQKYFPVAAAFNDYNGKKVPYELKAGEYPYGVACRISKVYGGNGEHWMAQIKKFPENKDVNWRNPKMFYIPPLEK